MGNGGSNLPPGPGIPPQQLPGWLGSGVQIVTQVGVPTVFAGILLWFVLTKIGGTLSNIDKNEEVRVRIVAAMQDTLVAALNRQTELFVAAIERNIETNKRLGEDIRASRRMKEEPR